MGKQGGNGRGGYPENLRHGQVAGGRGSGREITNGVEALWPLDVTRKWSPDKKPRTRRCKESEENTGRIGVGTRKMDELMMG